MAVADERFRPFIALCAFAGFRLGEAAAVQLGDVDFLRKTLKVSRQVQRVNGGAIDVRAPKYGSERVVYLDDSLVNLLAQHVATYGTTGKDQWLFAGEGDDAPHQNTVGYWWRKTLRDAGPVRHQAPRSPALLRLRPDRGRVRRRHRPALTRTREGHDDTQHLRPPLADRRGPHPQGCGVDHVRIARTSRSARAFRGPVPPPPNVSVRTPAEWVGSVSGGLSDHGATGLGRGERVPVRPR